MPPESERRPTEEAPREGSGAGERTDEQNVTRTPSDIQIEAIPQELRDIPNWVAWKYVPSKGGKSDKPRKLPIDPKTGSAAKINDPSTWASLDEAVERMGSDQCAGVMFAVVGDGPYTGIDLDSCRDPQSGAIQADAQRIVESLQTFTEISPSGTGLHLIARGKLPKGGRHKGKVEMYDSGRFLTMTGWHLAGTPATIEDRNNQIALLHAEIFGIQETTKSSKPKKRLTDAQVLKKASNAKNGDQFEALWNGTHSAYDSQSEADLALCGMLAFWTGGDAGRVDQLFRQSGLMRSKWDEVHGEQTYGQTTIEKALNTPSTYEPGDAQGDGNAASALVGFALEAGIELFHDKDVVTYAAITVVEHREVYRTSDAAFKRWLRRLNYEKRKSAISTNALTDAVGVLEAKAAFEGQEHPVYVRVGGQDDRIEIDLGRPDWEVVRITARGWEIVSCSECRFRRPRGLAALPLPTYGGSVEELREFVNVRDEDWPLLVCWLAACYRPSGPYPLLELTGEHGSAKSTTARVLRALIDPSTAALRGEPREPRDLMITAQNSWLLALDNLSRVPTWLSDALCRIATGGGFSTRSLFTDDDEKLFDAQRPVLITGVEDVVVKPDLLDRSLVLSLPRIEDGNRQTEKHFWARFDESSGRIFGALLMAVSQGLRRLDEVVVDESPRMADFARWAVACEPALGLGPGSFLAAYTRNRAEAVELALEASPVARAILDLAKESPADIQATATELLERLQARFGDQKPPQGWPKAPHTFAGELRRVGPDLRAVGIDVSFERRGRDGRRIIEVRFDQAAQVEEHADADAPADGADAVLTLATERSVSTQPIEFQDLTPEFDAADAADASSLTPHTWGESPDCRPDRGCYSCGRLLWVRVQGGPEWLCPTCHQPDAQVVEEWVAPQPAIGRTPPPPGVGIGQTASEASEASATPLAAPRRPISADAQGSEERQQASVEASADSVDAPQPQEEV
jgi:hypothetical protein